MYFINHQTKATTFDDPRPLPSGWRSGKTQTGKTFFINDNLRKTQWEDPRPKIDVDRFVRLQEKSSIETKNETEEEKKEDKGKQNKKKIVIVGDGNIGKTSMVTVFITGSFPGEYIPSVYKDKNDKDPKKDFIVDGKTYNVDLFDTAGQDEYDTTRPKIYPGTDVFLVCYSVLSKYSFNDVKNKWVQEIKQHSANTPWILVGMKSDLRDDDSGMIPNLQNRLISIDDAKKLGNDLGAAGYYECSALFNTGLNQLFEAAIRAAQ